MKPFCPIYMVIYDGNTIMIISFLREVIIFAEQLWCTLSIWRQSDRQLIKAFVIIKNGKFLNLPAPYPLVHESCTFQKKIQQCLFRQGRMASPFFPSSAVSSQLCVQDTHRDRNGCIVLVTADKYCIYISFSLSCCVGSANPCTCNPNLLTRS